MPEKKSQHFVPQSYMRNFSSDGRSIGLFHMASGALTPKASIKDQACRPYFYGRNLQTENKLAALEGATDDIIKAIIGNEQPPQRYSNAFFTLALSVITQELRTVEAAAQNNEMAEKLAKHLLSRTIKDPEMLKALPDLKLELTDPFKDMRQQAVTMSPMIHDMKLKLINNTSSVPFITSDHPVVKHNQLYQHQNYSPVGLACEGLQIILPISAKFALLFYDASAYRAGVIGSDIVRVTSAAEAESINALQWMRASQNILFPPGTDLDQLRTNAAIYMSLRLPERMRFEALRYTTLAGQEAELISSRGYPFRNHLKVSAIRTKAKPKRLDLLPQFPRRNERWTTHVRQLGDALKKEQITFDEFFDATRRP